MREHLRPGVQQAGRATISPLACPLPLAAEERRTPGPSRRNPGLAPGPPLGSVASAGQVPRAGGRLE
jgi:hypothetical protein